MCTLLSEGRLAFHDIDADARTYAAFSALDYEHQFKSTMDICVDP